MKWLKRCETGVKRENGQPHKNRRTQYKAALNKFRRDVSVEGERALARALDSENVEAVLAAIRSTVKTVETVSQPGRTHAQAVMRQLLSRSQISTAITRLAESRNRAPLAADNDDPSPSGGFRDR
jgi:hypothetical protein